MHSVVDDILSIVSVFFNVLRNVYILCLWIGWAITTVIVGLIKFVVSLGNNFVWGIGVLGDDLVSFLDDVGDLLEKLTIEASEAVGVAFNVCSGTVVLLVGSVATVPTLMYEMGSSIKILSYCLHVLVLVKDAVLLLGICIWEAFALIFTALVYLNEAPHVVLVFAARTADRAIVDFLSIIETYWFKSLSGLCLGSALYFLVKRMGYIPDLHFSVILRHFHRNASLTFKSVWLYVWLLLRKGVLFARRMLTKVGYWWRELVEQFVSYTPTKAALEIKLEKEKASTMCVVCMDRRRDVMILNCRHMLMCRQCALTVAVGSGDCPVCRLPIDNIISVYT